MTSASARAPVLLCLSSWDEKRLPLGQWIAAEVQRLYGITARVGADWLARGRLLPLLDGLDEVAEAHRAACAEAINTFRVEHPGVSLVVTCRTAEYRELPGALQHGDAIRLLPLEREQIEGYLQGASPALDGLRQAMAQDRWLAEMATSPFWLRAMGLAYRDQTVEQVVAIPGVFRVSCKSVPGCFILINMIRLSPESSGFRTPHNLRAFAISPRVCYPAISVYGCTRLGRRLSAPACFIISLRTGKLRLGASRATAS